MHRFIFTVALFAGALFAASSAGAATYDSNYARDRSEIEDLQARYMFALDSQDPDAYAGTFTEDGVLDWARAVVTGREAIRKEVQGMRDEAEKRAAGQAPERPSRLRHFIANVAIKIDGDRATGRAYWFEFNNDTRDRRPYVGAYGHYEDELRRVNGEWLFSKRKIYNEQMGSRSAPSGNLAW